MPQGFEFPDMDYLGMLGRGGTADVAKVYSHRFSSKLALKVPRTDRPDSLAEFSRLAQRESHLIGDVRFPGLVRLLHHQAAPRPYLLMQLCSSDTADKIDASIDLMARLNLISAIAASIEYLHAIGIVHGDLKGSNIFLPADTSILNTDRLFYTRLSDLSMGKRTDEPDSARAGMGTVGYMAPEILLDTGSSISSDLFALGAIAYEILTGKHPFAQNESDPAVINSKVREHQPEPLDKLLPKLPLAAANIVHKLLNKAPADRPESAWTVCEELGDAGVQYPFRKALRPVHFLNGGTTTDECLTRCFQPDCSQTNAFSRLVGQSMADLRMIAGENFRRGNLAYGNGRFNWRGNLYWPYRLRRTVLRQFTRADWKTRRQLVSAAVIGDTSPLSDGSTLANTANNTKATPALPLLLRALLRPATVKRLSLKLAAAASRESLHNTATRLYMQAGSLNDAERCAIALLDSDQENKPLDQNLLLVQQVIQLASDLGKLFDIRNLLLTRADRLRQAGDAVSALNAYHSIIDLYRDQLVDKPLAECYKGVGDLHKIKQRPADGLQALEKAMDIYSQLGDEIEISHTLNNIGNIHWVASDYTQSLRHYRRALRIQRRHDAQADVASTLHNIAGIYAVQGNFVRSSGLFKMSLTIKKEIGDQGEIARTLNNLGYICCMAGKMNEAVDHLQESLRLNRTTGSRKEILFNLENLSEVTSMAGRLAESLQYIKEGHSLAESLGDRPHIGAFSNIMATVLRRTGRFGEIKECFERVEEVLNDCDNQPLMAQLDINRATFRLAIGDYEAGRSFVEAALRRSLEFNLKPEQLGALIVSVRIEFNQDVADQALALADQLHSNRDRVIIQFYALANCSHQPAKKLPKNGLDRLIAQLSRFESDVEISRLCNIAARHLIAIDDVTQAEMLLQRAHRFASRHNLLPDLIVTNSLLGQIALSKSDYEIAFGLYRQALTHCKIVAGSIVDRTDQQMYLSQPSVQCLAAEIKKLNALLVKA
ncbi:MAG: tetratricopeptide repeat protein [Candidatus Zixiibacteriota bacterium]